MTDFVRADFTTDPQDITDKFVDTVAATKPGYVADDAHFESIIVTEAAELFADLAGVAALMTDAAFRAQGTKLFNVPYQSAASATAATTWTLADTVGHTIEAGWFLTISNLAFYVQTDVTVPAGSSSATVTLVAAEPGTTYNDLIDPPQINEEIDWVTDVTLVGATSGGADAEDDDSYANRLATELTLQAPRPITASDYAAFVLSVPSDVVSAGVQIGRATAIDGFNPSATGTFTATTTASSATLTSVSSITGLGPGTALSGTGIPAGAVVLSASGTTVTMSAAATASGSVTVTATGTYGNERVVYTVVTDPSGNALAGSDMTAISNWLAGYREANFVTPAGAPTYTKVYVTYEIHPLPGYDHAALLATTNQALANYLAPLQWGLVSPTSDGTGGTFLTSNSGFNVIRYNKLLGIIEGVAGVDYVPSGSAGLAIGFAASPTGTSDLTLPGAVPLPSSDLTTPTIVGSIT